MIQEFLKIKYKSFLKELKLLSIECKTFQELLKDAYSFIYNQYQAEKFEIFNFIFSEKKLMMIFSLILMVNEEIILNSSCHIILEIIFLLASTLGIWKLFNFGILSVFDNFFEKMYLSSDPIHANSILCTIMELVILFFENDDSMDFDKFMDYFQNKEVFSSLLNFDSTMLFTEEQDTFKKFCFLGLKLVSEIGKLVFSFYL